MKLVPLGMPAKVVVVFKNQDACRVARALTVEICRRKSAESSPDDHEIIGFVALCGLASILPKCAIVQTMRDFKLTRMTATQSRVHGRVVALVVLWFAGVIRTESVACPSPQFCPALKSTPLECRRESQDRKSVV